MYSYIACEAFRLLGSQLALDCEYVFADERPHRDIRVKLVQLAHSVQSFELDHACALHHLNPLQVASGAMRAVIIDYCNNIILINILTLFWAKTKETPWKNRKFAQN